VTGNGGEDNALPWFTIPKKVKTLTLEEKPLKGLVSKWFHSWMQEEHPYLPEVPGSELGDDPYCLYMAWARPKSFVFALCMATCLSSISR